MKTRKAVKDALQQAGALNSGKFILVGLSGGADSLALAAAVAWVAERNDVTAGAVIVNHNLQEGSRRIAEEAAEKARQLGLYPVVIKNVTVSDSPAAGGPENAARDARYAAFEETLDMLGGSHILTAHTKNDNAEQVLISILRGSGSRSLAGIRKERDYLIRPFLTEVDRAETEKACSDQQLQPWNDPHNKNTEYTRVRVRENIIPVLKQELGDSVVDSLNRTAEIASADAEAFDWMVEQVLKDIDVEKVEDEVTIPVNQLTPLPEGILNRVIRKVVATHFGESITYEQTVNVAKLVTAWHGQKFINTVGVTAQRANNRISFTRTA